MGSRSRHTAQKGDAFCCGVLEWPSQSPDLKSYRKFVGRTEKTCASKEAYKPDSVTPALSGGMGQNSPDLLWEACGRLPEVKQFKGNATKY